jgi:hypothetical protein
MSQHSHTSPYLIWAKERMNEMDAVLASLQAKAAPLQAEASAKRDRLISDLKKNRDEFKAAAAEHAEIGEAAWEKTRSQLEAQWNAFEGQMQTYFATVGKHVEQQQATFRDVAAAQVRAWRETAEKVQESASKLAAARRPEIDAVIKEMKSEAAEAEARLQKLKHAERQSWSALSTALADSRKAFDKASRKAWDALKRAAA